MSSAVTLSSLAMLKVNIDSGKDYLEYLRPYVLQVLIEAPPVLVTDASIAGGIKQLCGLEIPKRTVNIILQRLSRNGYLSKDNGVYQIAKQLPSTDVAAARVDAARHISAVTSELIAFAGEQPKRDLTENEASDCLVAFLSQFSIPCLRAFLRGTALPRVGDADWQTVLVSHFVTHLSSKPTLFESFMKLVQGHMLANALLCPDLQSVARTYEDVIFYFDTPLLIDLLGLGGEEEKAAVAEVLQLVQRLHGEVRCFSHTFEELINAIRSSADFVDNPKGRGSIVEEARKSGRTRTDLILIAEHAGETLDALGISRYPTPPYDPKTHRFEISEKIFGSVLDDEINYHNPKAREYDIKSVRSVYVLRKGIVPFSIERSRAVLVTSNVSFSKAAFEYGREHEQSREVSTVITDFSLANTAWLKAPQGAPSLPRKEVLAFAYAALRPSADFWERVLKEAEKLEKNGTISPRDHQLLRSSHHVQQELMRLTLGEDKALTLESITETLGRVSADIRSEETVKVEKALAEKLETEDRLARESAKVESIKQKVFWRCDQRARCEARVLSVLTWVFQSLIAIFGVWKLPENAMLGWITVAAAIASGVVRLIGTQWDIKPLKAEPAYIEWRIKKLLRKQYMALGMEYEL